MAAGALLAEKKNDTSEPGGSKSTKSVRVAIDIHSTATKAAPQAETNQRAFIEPLLWACVKKIDEDIRRVGEDAVTERANALKHLENAENLGSFNIDPELGKVIAKRAGLLQTSAPKLLDAYLRPMVVDPYRKAIGAEAVRLKLIYPGLDPEPKTVFFVGPVSAGAGVEVFDNAHERIDLGEELGGEGRYVFTVRGDSMEDERIFEGDNVIVQRDPGPKTGDAVVVRYDGSLMLKKLVRNTERETRVVSCNQRKTPEAYVLDFDRGDMLLGKFVASYRKAK